MRVPASAEEAIAIQKELAQRVVTEDQFARVRTIAGIDVGYDVARDFSRAVVVVMDAESFEIKCSVVAYNPTPFPYIPGLLSFREVPVIIRALSCLKEKPDLLMVDGHGIAHPRRLGIAAHLGVVTDLPAIGVAKKKLCGSYTEPGLHKGEISPLTHRGERIGTVLRSRDKVKPLFISPGHKISLESAVGFVEKALKGYRLPETTRLADKLSKTR